MIGWVLRRFNRRVVLVDIYLKMSPIRNNQLLELNNAWCERLGEMLASHELIRFVR